MSLLIADAFAQDATAAGTGGLMSLAPMVLIILVFYIIIIRPQSRKMKEHRSMLSTLERGDRVMTSGGIIGKIADAGTDPETVNVEIANGIVVQVRRSTITEALDKKAPAPVKPKLAKKQSV